MNGRRSRQMKHLGIEDAFVWVISTGGDPVSHNIIAAAGPRLLLAVLNVRVCARSIGLHRYLPVPRIGWLLTRKHRTGRRAKPAEYKWLMFHCKCNIFSLIVDILRQNLRVSTAYKLGGTRASCLLQKTGL